MLQDVAIAAREARSQFLNDARKRIDEVAAQMTVLAPTQRVVDKTLSMYPVKSLAPFDEMILAAVLVAAASVAALDPAAELYFCNLNKRDFDPANVPSLTREYAVCRLAYLPSFRVP